MAKNRRARLSTPGEHGGLITLAGSMLLSMTVAPARSVAVAAALIYGMAYLARGPIERKARRFRLRAWDHRAMAVYAVAVLGCAAWIAHERTPLMAAFVLASAAAITGIGAMVTKARVHRALVTEFLGMGACGASAGVSVYAGGLAVEPSLLAGFCMAVYATAAVVMVRAEVRKLEPRERVLLSWLGVALLVLGGAIACMVERPMAMVFLPRGAHAAWRAIQGIGNHRIFVIALRESLELLAFVVLSSLVLTHTVDFL